MTAFVRFQTQLRCEWTNRPAGVFAAAVRMRDRNRLADTQQELLEQHLAWLNKNLTVPALDEFGWRCLFWFRSDAKGLIRRIWELAAILREEGIYVRKFWTTEPGRIIYQDRFQVGAVPRRKNAALCV